MTESCCPPTFSVRHSLWTEAACILLRCRAAETPQTTRSHSSGLRVMRQKYGARNLGRLCWREQAEIYQTRPNTNREEGRCNIFRNVEEPAFHAIIYPKDVIRLVYRFSYKRIVAEEIGSDVNCSSHEESTVLHEIVS